jgi:hypothetical protein
MNEDVQSILVGFQVGRLINDHHHLQLISNLIIVIHDYSWPLGHKPFLLASVTPILADVPYLLSGVMYMSELI